MTTVQKTTTRKVTKTTKTTTTESSCESPQIVIEKKGDFFNDAFFEDRRQDYQVAVKDVLSKFGQETSTTDDNITNYRNMRTQDLKEENQAVRSTQDDRFHKIVIDVQDFIVGGGEVNVKTVDEQKVVIEGHLQRQEGGKTSSKSFMKTFIYSDAEMEEITSVMSSDGILTVTIPRKQQLQQIMNVEKKVTTVTQQAQNTTNTSSITGDKTLCITKKGNFFDDSFFEDDRQPFQEAVKEVLQKSNETTSQTDVIKTYRNLRQRELKEETQAVAISDDQNHHKIIVDVQDFINGGEVIVKTVGEREVVIEGSIKKQEGNKTSSKSFRKRYVLPEDIVSESVTSVVSADGVLTIIAPKKPRALMPGEVNVPLAIHQADTNKQVVTANTTNTALQTVDQTSTNQSQIASQESQQNVSIQKKVTTVTQQSHVTSDNTSNVSSDRSLSITKKGDFFNDSFFEDARKPFQEAVRDVLQKSNITTSQTDEISSYRNLRQRELKEETQAATVSDDQKQHKIIVDVLDFINGGEVVVKTVGEREVVIEGSIKKQEGNTTSSKSFRKRYVLPEDIISELVTSVVSSDGVLTIIAPKKVRALMPGEVSVPLAIEHSDVNKQLITANTTNTALQTVNQTSTNQSQIASQQTQQNVTIQKKVTTVTQQSHVTSDNTSNVSSDRSLCITKKGDFFNDSFFEDARKPFQEAVRDVLQKSNISSSQSDELTSYRNLRQTDLKEETQAVAVSDSQQQHKIIVDVMDFMNGGEVTVKTVGEREVVIEGSIKKQEGNRTSSKSFRKRYVLPDDIQVDSVSSVVSADGVLTINAPRKLQVLQQQEVYIPVMLQQQDACKQELIANTTSQAIQSINQSSSQEVQRNITVQKKIASVTQESHIATQGTSSLSSDRTLTITRKGDFFDDSFFEDVRKPFQQAVQEVLQKTNEASSKTDIIATYRSLRQRNLQEETQAVAVRDDQRQHKIVVDVQDFINGGSVEVKTVNEREVVIEGRIMKQEGNTMSSKSFRKRYVLPEDIQSELVTSVVSSDGVLTINAPRK